MPLPPDPSAVLDLLPDLVIVLDHEGYLAAANRTALSFLDVEADTHPCFWKLQPEPFGEGFRAEAERAVREQSVLPYRGYSAARETWMDLRLAPTPAGLVVSGRRAAPRSGERGAEPGSAAGRKEALFQAFVEQAGEGFWLTDAQGRCLELNEAACQILGYPRAELLGRNLRELTHPDDWRHRAGEVERLQRGETVRAERRMLRSDGTWARVEGMGRLFEADKYLIFFRDVTQSRAAEEALARSERGLRDAQRLAGLGSWTLELRTGAAWWSEQMYRLFHVEPAITPSLAVARERVHPEDWPKVEAHVAASLEKGASFEDLELRLLWPDGSRHWLLARGEVERDEQGQPFRLNGTCLDITERKRAELARRVTEMRYGVLMNVIPQLVWTLDADGRLLEVNDRWREYFGCIPEPLRAPEWERLIHPDDLDSAMDHWRHSLRTGDPFEVEYRLRRHDGKYRWYLARAIPAYDETGRILLWCRTCTDIHDRQLADRALREEHRRKDEFLAMLAHELRNPLSPIATAAHLLGLRPDERETVERQRLTIERNVRHLARLVDDLLEVARINEGKIELRPERVELAAVVQQAITTVQSAIQQRGQELSTTLPGEPVHLQADPVRLTQVLVNLLTNASKYTDPGGWISLSASREGDRAVLRVRDNGRGIDAELLPRIFDLFVQGERTLARTEGGLGVGLTLARRLVELHGGTLSAHSEGPGRGSEFVVRLPAEPARAPGQTGAATLDRGGGPHRRVLLVEDNVDAAETLAEVLEMWGHEVRVAHDGRTGLELAAVYQPEVVLLDVGLPGMDGYEVARRLRADARTAGAVVVALTGYGDTEHRQRAQEAGFDDHLTKPVDLNALRQRLSGEATVDPQRGAP